MTIGEIKQEILERIKTAPNELVDELANAYRTMTEAEAAEDFMKARGQLIMMTKPETPKGGDDEILDLGEIH